MGEEEKKPEEKKAEGKKEEEKAKVEEKPKAEEAAKKEESGGGEGEKKDAGGGEAKAEEAAPPPPTPEEVVMRVFMHCEGCAKKVKRSLKGFEGVEDVKTDCKSHKVVVKGRKAAEDPMKVVERVQKKSGRKVELLSPLPPPKPEKKEEEKKEEEKPKIEEKKEEPVVVTVVLKVHMHCEACAQEIKKRILKMKGVQSAEPELKSSEVTVKGVFDPPKLVEYVYKRTGKHAVIVKQEPEEKKPEAGGDGAGKEEVKEEKAEGGGDGKDKPEGDKEKKEEGNAGEEKAGKEDAAPTAAAAGTGEDGGAAAASKVELKKNELFYYYPRYPAEYAYPPQIFSDENPNACSVM